MLRPALPAVLCLCCLLLVLPLLMMLSKPDESKEENK